MFFKCHICRSNVIEIKKFKKYFLVSSDCKPTFFTGRLVICTQCKTIQKPINKQWKDRIKNIYNKYQLSSLTLGAKKFN